MTDSTLMTVLAVVGITLALGGYLGGYTHGQRANLTPTRPPAPPAHATPSGADHAQAWLSAHAAAPPAAAPEWLSPAALAAVDVRPIRTPDKTAPPFEYVGRHREPAPGMSAIETTAAFPSYKPKAGVS